MTRLIPFAILILLITPTLHAEDSDFLPFPSHVETGKVVRLLFPYEQALITNESDIEITPANCYEKLTIASQEPRCLTIQVVFKTLPATITISSVRDGKPFGDSKSFKVSEKTDNIIAIEGKLTSHIGSKMKVEQRISGSLIATRAIDWSKAVDDVKSKLTDDKELRFLIKGSDDSDIPVIILAQKQFTTIPGQSANGEDGYVGKDGRSRNTHGAAGAAGNDGVSGGRGAMGTRGVRGSDGNQPRPFIVSAPELNIKYLLLVFSADGQQGGKGGSGGKGGVGGDGGSGGDGGVGGNATDGSDSRKMALPNGEEEYTTNGQAGGHGGRGGDAGRGGNGAIGQMGGAGGSGGSGGNGADAKVFAPEGAFVVIRLGNGANAGQGGNAGNNGKDGDYGKAGKPGKGGAAGKGGKGKEDGPDGNIGADGRNFDNAASRYSYKITTAPGGKGGRAGESGKELAGSTGDTVRVVIPGTSGKHGWAGKRGGRD